MNKGCFKPIYTLAHKNRENKQQPKGDDGEQEEQEDKCFMSGGEKRENFFTTSLHRFAFYDSTMFMLQKPSLFVNE